MLYRKTTPTNTLLNVNKHLDGETIEQKVRRIVNNKEAITDGANPIYTERKQGVMPEYNPRTDRWDVAIDAMDTAHKSTLAKRDNVVQMPKPDAKNDGGTEPIQGTSEPSE